MANGHRSRRASGSPLPFPADDRRQNDSDRLKCGCSS
jgi:hypothetical protein